MLSDEWLEQGTAGGQLLAERLIDTLTGQRCAELGFETWLGICSIHRLVLFLMPEPVFDEIAATGDEELAFRVVAWLKSGIGNLCRSTSCATTAGSCTNRAIVVKAPATSASADPRPAGPQV